MDAAPISAVAHRWHPVAPPVSDESLHRLLTLLVPPDEGRVLDLGCGSGEWLLRLLADRPGLRGVGVDTSTPALAEARAQAERRGLADRVEFIRGDAAAHAGRPCDVVLCVGATHAFGGLAGTLAGVRRHLRPAAACCSATASGRPAPPRRH